VSDIAVNTVSSEGAGYGQFCHRNERVEGPAHVAEAVLKTQKGSDDRLLEV